eukprot:TRINITY_DN24968_c0_g1_i1.p1 TRINITY_DN24968_c0_g1~~TRINITY_DN24968_c0_g1_i1.p1  ORF type:complete len:401 (-),score=9.43 TRINITY_DN24968_c0_g1_i1:405-1607(-)
MATCALNPVDVIERVKAARKRRLQELYVTGSRKRHASNVPASSRFTDAEEGSGDSWDESMSSGPSSPAPPPVGPVVPDELEGSWERQSASRLTSKSPVSLATTRGPVVMKASPASVAEGSSGCAGEKRQQLLPMLAKAAEQLEFRPRDLLCAAMLHDACQLKCRLGSACRHQDAVQRQVLALTCLFVAHKAKAASTSSKPLSGDEFCAQVAGLDGRVVVKGCMLERQLVWVTRLFPSIGFLTGADGTCIVPQTSAVLKCLWALFMRGASPVCRARYMAAFVLRLRTTPFGRASFPTHVIAASADVAIHGAEARRVNDLLEEFSGADENRQGHVAETLPARRGKNATDGIVADHPCKPRSVRTAKRRVAPAESGASAAAVAAAADVLTDIANSCATGSAAA